MDQALFAAVKESKEVRKALLMSSKEVVNTLRHYEKYQLLRVQNEDLQVQFHRSLAELAALQRKLKGVMPKVAHKTPERKPITKPTPRIVQKSNIDVLEDELSRIEARLSALE